MHAFKSQKYLVIFFLIFKYFSEQMAFMFVERTWPLWAPSSLNAHNNFMQNPEKYCNVPKGWLKLVATIQQEIVKSKL